MPEKKEKTVVEMLQTVQAELKAPKGQFNSFGKYKYRSCEDILEAVKPLLVKVGATLVLTDEIVCVGDRYYVKASAMFGGKDTTKALTVYAYAREPEAKKGMDVAQITGATSSYARKYALNGLFAIDDAKDADSTNNGKQNNNTPKDQMLEIVDKAFKEFAIVHQTYLDANDQVKLDEDKFIKAVQKQFGKLPTVVESIPQIIKAIKLEDVIDDEFDSAMAKGKDEKKDG